MPVAAGSLFPASPVEQGLLQPLRPLIAYLCQGSCQPQLVAVPTPCLVLTLCRSKYSRASWDQIPVGGPHADMGLKLLLSTRVGQIRKGNKFFSIGCTHHRLYSFNWLGKPFIYAIPEWTMSVPTTETSLRVQINMRVGSGQPELSTECT